jgi:hypothetical protein
MATEIVFHRIEVRRNGNRFGTFWIGKKGVQWKPRHGRDTGNITWKDFDILMKRRVSELGARWTAGKRRNE